MIKSKAIMLMRVIILGTLFVTSNSISTLYAKIVCTNLTDCTIPTDSILSVKEFTLLATRADKKIRTDSIINLKKLIVVGTHADKKILIDSIINLKEITVVATRADKKTPIAFTTISAKQLHENNVGKDIPYLLNMQPSILTTSDAGMGVGYTSIRIRGTDDSRINISVNGVPMNDAESNMVYFVNMTDLASSLEDIQVQRGAGTSTNGGGAFGGSVNMRTSGFNNTAGVDIESSYGSFNTHKETIKATTGLLNKHWSFDGRYSNIGTDGYIDRASSKLNSYMLQAAHYGESTVLRFITFNGWEQTYHAWNYASKDDMQKYGRTYNSCGEYKDDNGDTQYYKDQTDNYNQQNYQLLLTKQFSNYWNLHAAAFYTHGKGYYEEYKTDTRVNKYGLTSYVGEDGELVKSDLVRRKKMANDFGGGVFSLHYRSKNLHFTLGGGLNRYVGDHFGNVISVRDKNITIPKGLEYYRNQGRKTNANIYAKSEYQLTKTFNIYTDLQYHYIDYKVGGKNDNWDWNSGAMQYLDIHDSFYFFNPKFGINWQATVNNRFYASISIAQKEPTRNNYTDGFINKYPKSELLKDYELGYEYRTHSLFLGANVYFMDYKNQLVLTGELNEIGEPVAENVANSYRTGIELMGKWKFARQWTFNANATLSKNCIKDYEETLYDNNWENPISKKIGDMDIAFSPNFIGNARLTYENKSWFASLSNQYVSKQYLTNSEQEDLTIDSYNVMNFEINYTFTLHLVKKVTVGITVYNLLDEEYENNGWGYSGYVIDNGKPLRQNSNGLSAQAGIHFMGHIALKF